MRGTVFYSWQATTDHKTCRFLIRDALKDATKALGQNNLKFDEATRNEPGSPDIFAAVLAKIQRCSVFVADMTLVGTYSDDRYTPNPNVLVEYGYALRSIGPNLIIPVLNSHYGPPENLPFDLRGRAIRVQYSLGPEEEDKTRLKERRKALARRLKQEIELAIDQSLWEGIRSEDRPLVEYFLNSSEHGKAKDPSVSLQDLSQALDHTESEVRDAVESLAGSNLVGFRAVAGNSMKTIWPENGLFWRFDRLFSGWNVENDARTIAELLVNGPPERRNQLASSSLEGQLSWDVRRINPALTWLVQHGLVRHSNRISHPFAVASILESAETRQFVRND